MPHVDALSVANDSHRKQTIQSNTMAPIPSPTSTPPPLTRQDPPNGVSDPSQPPELNSCANGSPCILPLSVYYANNNQSRKSTFSPPANRSVVYLATIFPTCLMTKHHGILANRMDSRAGHPDSRVFREAMWRKIPILQTQGNICGGAKEEARTTAGILC